MPDRADVTAATFVVQLDRLRSDASANAGASVPMRQIFALAKDSIDAPLSEIEILLVAPEHDTRVGAVSIMDWQARRRGTTDGHRRELFELYLRRHDRIDTWDLVDRAAPYVLGGHLVDEDRTPLYALARSPDPANLGAIPATHRSGRTLRRPPSGFAPSSGLTYG